MKSTINFYYNLFPTNIIEKDNFFYFWVNENKFYFVPFENDINVVMKIYERLVQDKKKVNKIILNKDKNLVTVYKSKYYALIMVDCIENEIVDLNDFFSVILDSVPVDWGSVWERKIDYLEYQVNQRALGKDNILNSFGYYVGMAENAIQYYNLLEKKDVVVGIQHKRIYANNYEINYYNPLNMIVDYNVRDIAEYIKFSFFDNKLNIDNIIRYINKMNLNSTMMNLLYIRLIFPTYYFDNYEKYLDNYLDEKILINILNKASSYENFLKSFYQYYGERYNLLRIDWFF